MPSVTLFCCCYNGVSKKAGKFDSNLVHVEMRNLRLIKQQNEPNLIELMLKNPWMHLLEACTRRLKQDCRCLFAISFRVKSIYLVFPGMKGGTKAGKRLSRPLADFSIIVKHLPSKLHMLTAISISIALTTTRLKRKSVHNSTKLFVCIFRYFWAVVINVVNLYVLYNFHIFPLV